MPDDADILRRYAETGAEDAFAEIVRRHLNLTWAAARRITGDADLARDVAQTVFADLARKARYLPRNTPLAGWLYRAACLAAYKVNRGNRRRAERERQAMNDASLQPEPAPVSAEADRLLPQLDEALGALGGADRDAVVLRYLAGKSLAEVGAVLGVNEEAARKRVSRAVERLRAWFGRRGTAATSAALVATLGLAGTQVAPGGLAATLSAASLAGAGTLGVFEILTLMKTKIAVSAAALAVVAAPLTYQQVELHRLRDENRVLHSRAAAQSPAGAAKSAPDAADGERLQAEHLELLRLRGEVTQLRADSAELAELKRELTRQHDRQLESAAQAGAQPESDAVAAEKAVGIAKLNDFKNWGLALILYASEHNDTFPPTLAEARRFLPESKDAPILDESQLELTIQGRLADIKEPARTILARERQTWTTVRGRQARTYVFADGHSEIRAPEDGEFAEWERARGVANP